ncbi:MAG: hypothetical protein ABJN98_00055 [Roseibium sp.]
MDTEDALEFAVQAARDAAASAARAAEEAAKGPELTDYLDLAPGLVLSTILFVFVLRNWSQLGGVIDRLSGFEALGVKVELAASKELQKASELTNTDLRVTTTVSGVEKRIHVTEDDEHRVLKRAGALKDVIKDRVILWVDDQHENNLHEIRTFDALGLNTITEHSNTGAVSRVKMGVTRAHVVITDISRKGDNSSGDLLPEAFREEGFDIPVIFYITKVDNTQPLPVGAFGLTNRPDELLHLVLDALERIRPLN